MIHWSEFDPGKVKSPALLRILEEVRHEQEQDESEQPHPQSYDRVHNRHNRAGNEQQDVPGRYDRVHNRHNRGR